jgi:hypothetical protein
MGKARVPSEKDLERLIGAIEAVERRAQDFGRLLTAEERRHTTKMRHGGAAVVNLVGALAQKHRLALPRTSVERMRDSLALAQRVGPLARTVTRLSQTLADTILAARSECWWAATAYYSALTRMAQADPALWAELRPAVEFFARGRRGQGAKRATP